MADFRRLQPGDEFLPAAAEWNTLLDAGEWYQRQQQGVIAPATGAALGPGEVLVRNDSGEARDRWDVLGISDASVLNPATSIDGWAETPAVCGVTPEFPGHDGKFVVLLEPAAKNAIVRGRVSGRCQVRLAVDEGDGWYQFADVTNDDASKLTLLPYGSAQVLWRGNVEGEGEEEETVALVRLGLPGGIHKITAYLSTDLEHDDVAVAVRTRKRPSGNYDLDSVSFEIHPPQWFTGMIPSGTHITAWWDPFARHWYMDGGPCQV